MGVFEGSDARSYCDESAPGHTVCIPLITHFQLASRDEDEFHAQVGRIAARQQRQGGGQSQVKRDTIEAAGAMKPFSQADAQDAAAMSFSDTSLVLYCISMA